MKIQKTIFSTRLTGKERAATTSSLFGVRFIWIASFAFDTAGGLCDDYDDGYWHYNALSNGSFYMSPAQAGGFHVVSANGFKGDMSADAFGIACCLTAYSLLSGSPDEGWAKQCAEHYHLLLAYVTERPELRNVLLAID